MVTEGVLGLARRPTLRRALAFLTRPGVIGSLLLALCVAVYYMRARARAQQSMVRMLRQMLLLQAKDKDFLLAAISKVSNGGKRFIHSYIDISLRSDVAVDVVAASQRHGLPSSRHIKGVQWG
ncbi:hypothetical protein evm_015190 [Chilo suppressalis]|nr:hypothetical protein evm_015190 [Chilo suppressalis]